MTNAPNNGIILDYNFDFMYRGESQEAIPEQIMDEVSEAEKTGVLPIVEAGESLEAKTSEQLFSLVSKELERLRQFQGGELEGVAMALEGKLFALEKAYHDGSEHISYILGQVRSLIGQELAVEIRQEDKHLKAGLLSNETERSNPLGRILGVLKQDVQQGRLAQRDERLIQNVFALIEDRDLIDLMGGIEESVTNTRALKAKKQFSEVVNQLISRIGLDLKKVTKPVTARERLDLLGVRAGVIRKMGEIEIPKRDEFDTDGAFEKKFKLSQEALRRLVREYESLTADLAMVGAALERQEKEAGFYPTSKKPDKQQRVSRRDRARQIGDTVAAV